MNTELLIALVTIGATLLLVVTGLLNFSVFVRQLRAARDQLDTARRQLESARQQPEIQLVQRAMSEMSDHLKLLIERPYLRPYFYDNKAWVEGDKATLNEVKAMAELMLNNFASAIIHSAVFPQYRVRGVEDDQIRSRRGLLPIPACRLGPNMSEERHTATLGVRPDLRSRCGRPRRVTKKTTASPGICGLAHPLELARYSLKRAGAN